MTDPKICPTCGSALPADATGGACPKCLLQAGFATGGDPPAGEHVPTPEELAPKFPGLVIEEVIGRGGMGVVYRARHKALDREVALKVLPERVAADRAFGDRFQREARALAKLQHPNIVGVHDFGQTGGLYWLVMEFVDGLSIRQAMRAGAIGPKEALAIVPQICDALQYAHEHGVVHRDIKPENVMLDKSGRVKVADFGLAKLMQQGVADATLTGAGQVMGTVHYMAPEQWEHPKDVDHRADIYSLGVVFYEMLTGELPLGQFEPPSSKVQIDVRLDEVVLRSLEKAPERRYQQASQIKTQVGVIAEGPAPQRFGPPSEETITAPPTHSTMVNVPLDMPRREKWFSLALIVGGTFYWWIRDSEPIYLMLPLTGLALLGLSFWHTRRRAGGAAAATTGNARLSRLAVAGGLGVPAAVALPLAAALHAKVFGGTLAFGPGEMIGLAVLVAAAWLASVVAWVRIQRSGGKLRGAVWAVMGTFLPLVAGCVALPLSLLLTATPDDVSGARSHEAPEAPSAAQSAQAAEFQAVDARGNVAAISSDERNRIQALWEDVQRLRPDAPVEDAVALYHPGWRSNLASNPDKGRAGDHGLPLLAADRLTAPLSSFRLMRLTFNSQTRPEGAWAVATNGREQIWFHFARYWPEKIGQGALSTWWFDSAPVVLTNPGVARDSRVTIDLVRRLSWLRMDARMRDLDWLEDVVSWQDMKRLRDMPVAERKKRGPAGELGLAFISEDGLGGRLADFDVHSIGWDGDHAEVQLQHATKELHVRFRLARDPDDDWRLTIDPVKFE